MDAKNEEVKKKSKQEQNANAKAIKKPIKMLSRKSTFILFYYYY